MRAAVVTSFTEPLELQDRPVPTPGAGQVLVRLETCGLCHTDIHAAHGDWPVKPTPPFVPGHEGVGIVEAVGAGVTSRAVGDRVAIPWLGSACGHCDHCVAAGRPCARSSRTAATPSTVASPSTPWPTPRTPSPCPTASAPRRRPAHLRRRHHVQGGQGGPRPARPSGSRSSASAASATWRSSTRRLVGAEVIAVDVATRSSRWPPSWAPTTSSTPRPTTRSRRSPTLGGADVAIVAGRDPPGRSSRPSRRCAAADGSSASACRPSEGPDAACRSSTPCSRASR